MAQPNHSLYENVDQFMAANPPPEFINALKAFLGAPWPVVRETTWLPPAEEVAVREGLARELLENIFHGADEALCLTATRASFFLLMPLNILDDLAHMSRPDPSHGQLAGLVSGSMKWSFENLHDLVRYFLQGQHPESFRRKRKTPGQQAQPVEGNPGPDPGPGGAKQTIDRNENEKNKCLERDNNACIFTGVIHPQACHIVPFSFNSSMTNLKNYTRRFDDCLRMFFPGTDMPQYSNLIGTGLGCSDKAWNMLAVNPYLHSWWAKPHWGLECTGIVPQEGKYAVVLVFRWLPHGKGNAQRETSLKPGEEGFQRLLDDLEGPSYGEGRGPDMNGFATGIHHGSFRPILSGQEFRVAHDALEDAEKMQKMVDIQWACVRVAAMSGTAGPGDFDDDFSEFSFEREAFNRNIELSLSD